MLFQFYCLWFYMLSFIRPIYYLLYHIQTFIIFIQSQPQMIIETKTALYSSPDKKFYPSSSSSTISEFTHQQSKFCSTFIQSWDLFHVSISSFEVIQSQHLLGQKFVIYHMKVVTDHVCYYIDKRYRDFLQLFRSVSKLFKPKTMFPKKSNLKSKICPLLSQTRQQAFVNFINQLISLRHCNKSVVSELLIFLNMKKQYNSHDLDENIYIQKQISNYLVGNAKLFHHLIRHVLVKIQIAPEKSVKFLKEAQVLLQSATKSMIKLDDLRALILGFQKTPGLIEVCLSTKNQIVGLAFMRSLRKLLSPQTCPYAQFIRKIVELCPKYILKVSYPKILQNDQLLSSYFELLSLYIHNKEATDPDFSNIQFRLHILQMNINSKFTQWINQKQMRSSKMKKINSLNIPSELVSSFANLSLSRNNSYESSCLTSVYQASFENSLEIFDEEIDKIEKNERGQENFCRMKASGKSYYEISKSKDLMFFRYQSNLNIQQILEAITSWKYNKFVSSYYPPKLLTRIHKVFLNNGQKDEKLFQFEQDKDHQLKDSTFLKVRMIPPKDIQKINSFFFYIRIYKVAEDKFFIQFLYYFHSAKSRKFFASQLFDKTQIIWESGYNSFVSPTLNSVN